MKDDKEKICLNCIHSIEAKNEKVVGCKLLNFGKDYGDTKPIITPLEVSGEVFEGWFKGGMGMIKGFVTFKNSTCINFENFEENQTHPHTKQEYDSSQRVNPLGDGRASRLMPDKIVGGTLKNG